MNSINYYNFNLLLYEFSFPNGIMYHKFKSEYQEYALQVPEYCFLNSIYEAKHTEPKEFKKIILIMHPNDEERFKVIIKKYEGSQLPKVLSADELPSDDSAKTF
jgi:hypothetical protein